MLLTAACSLSGGKAQSGKTSGENGTSAGETAPEASPAAVETPEKTIGFYADTDDSYYRLVKDALKALAEQDQETNWAIEYKTGAGTPDDQLNAVNAFIESRCDAIVVIQNNPDTTSECIELSKAAAIPYFGATHYFGMAANAADSAGSTNLDFHACGVAAGEDALAAGVKKVIIIEGELGRDYASDQSLGFLEAYENAKKSLGEKEDGSKWTAVDIAVQKPAPAQIKGKPEVVVAAWESGGWTADSAKAKMAGIMAQLGADGWDGAYVQNNPMAEGAILAMRDAGLSTDGHWLGSCNGRELSWEWAKTGAISMDVNQSPALEGAILYQQIKAYFNGEEYRRHLTPYITPYNKNNIAEVEATLVPVTDVSNFIDKVNNNSIVWDIKDSKFPDAPGNW
jgi:ABC-type sugar transport system substrate-binding protein